MSVQASHILVKHQGSRNPTSWRDSDGVQIKKRTKEQAHTTLEKFIEEIKSGKRTFQEIAFAESECGSAQNHGDLGIFIFQHSVKIFFRKINYNSSMNMHQFSLGLNVFSV